MTTLREAAQQALEANANRYQVVRNGYWWRVKIGNGTQTVGQHYTKMGALRLAAELFRAFHDGGFVVQEALRAALAQQEQEPVAWRHKGAGHFTVTPLVSKFPEWEPLYTAPPRREWQGLRNKEIVQIVTDNLTGGDWVDVARAIEAKLKEKNA
jgi:hypothetical protein